MFLRGFDVDKTGIANGKPMVLNGTFRLRINHPLTKGKKRERFWETLESYHSYQIEQIMGMHKWRNELFSPIKWMAILVVIVFCSTKQATAQESMIPEVNYAYLEKLIDTARKYYPQVKIAQKKLEIANIAVKKSQLEWFNFFSVTLNYSPNGGAASLNQPTLAGFQVGFFVNIAALLQKPYIIKSSKVEYEIAKLSQMDFDMLMAADVKSRYLKYVQAGIHLKIQNRIALEAESIVKETRYKFEKGEVNFETFTKGVIYESDNRKGVIDAEANYLLAKSSLETIVGKKLSEIQ